METILQDLRYATRTLARQPGFTAIAVFTLAVGIGANTAIYSVVDATLLRTLPLQDPGRLMKISLVAPGSHGRAAPRRHGLVVSEVRDFPAEPAGFRGLGGIPAHHVEPDRHQ